MLKQLALCWGAAWATPESQQLSQKVGRWYDALENYQCERAEVPVTERAQYRGRASGARVVWRTAPIIASKRHATWKHATAQWWEAVASSIHELRMLRSRNRGVQQQQACVRRITACQAGPPNADGSVPPGFASSARGRELAQVASWSDEQIDEWEKRAEQAALKWAGQAFRQERSDFEQWSSSALTNSPQQVYRWTAQARQPANEEVPVDGDVWQATTADPVRALEALREPWARLWCEKGSACENDEYDRELMEVAEAISDLRREQGDSMPVTDADDIRAAAQRLRENAARGPDQLRPSDIARLPAAGRHALLEVISAAEEAWCWPPQWAHNIVKLLPRPGDTTRTRAVTLLPTPVRVWASLRRSIPDTWCEERAQFWDQAVAGSSALQAALLRCLNDEAMAALGWTVGAALLDIKGFYDHIRMGLLLREGQRWGFPMQAMAMSVSTYLAPRSIVWGPWTARWPVVPRRSVCTGERAGNHMARVCTYTILEWLHGRVPGAIIQQWVDDVPIRCVGTKRYVERGLAQLTKDAALELEKAGFTLAEKTVVAASDCSIAHRVRERLRREGVVVQVRKTAVDLGLDVGMGVRRARAKHMQRRRQAATRYRRILRLRRSVGKKIWQTTAVPCAGYAAKCLGATRSECMERRRELVRIVAGRGRGRSSTIALATTCGLSWDPRVSIPLQQFREWIKLWVTQPQARKNTRAAWHRVLKGVRKLRPEARWRVINGPIAAMQVALLEAGWEPTSADVWQTPDRSARWEWPAEEELDGTVLADYKDLEDEFRRSLIAAVWAQAAGQQATDSSLAQGCDEDDMKREVKALEARSQWIERAAHIAVTSGGVWTQQRLYDIGRATSPACPRCGAASETWEHALWECPANNELEACQATAGRIEQALEQMQAHPALWLQGLATFDQLQAGEPAEDEQWEIDGLGEDGKFAQGGYKPGWVLVFGDASGGPDASCPHLRRVGCALAQWDWHRDQAVATVKFALTGARQEVGRGELRCLLEALERTTGGLCFVTDRQSVSDGWQERRWEKLGHATCDADLWRRVGQHAAAARRPIVVLKTESHVTDADLAEGFSTPTLRRGNEAADTLAGQAAERQAVGVAARTSWRNTKCRAADVRKRGRAVLVAMWEKTPPIKGAPVATRPRLRPEVAIANSVTASGHIIEAAPGCSQGQRCRRCLVGIPAVRRRKWLRTHPCAAAGGPGDGSREEETAAGTRAQQQGGQGGTAAAASRAAVTIGNLDTHESHDARFVAEPLGWDRWVCYRCGCTARVKLQALARPCVAPTATGAKVLDRLAKGLQHHQWSTEQSRAKAAEGAAAAREITMG